jgi:hypothetical protein
MSQVFLTEATPKGRPKLTGKAAFRAALRGESAEALHESVASFKASPQFDASELVHFPFSAKH